jgi:hypothetical protein
MDTYPIDTPVAAWDLIGFGGTVDGRSASVRLATGRVLYEAVDGGEAANVRLARLDVVPGGLRQVNRWVHPDTPLVVVLDAD